MAGLVVFLSSAADAATSGDALVVKAHGLEMNVTALTDSILRVTITHEGESVEEASWVVAPSVRKLRAPTTIDQTGLRTSRLQAAVDSQTLALRVTDTAGKVIVADGATPIIWDQTGFTLRKAMPAAEHYFGLGDKTGVLDRRGGSFVNWNTDAWGFASSSDPTYKSIPFYIAAGGDGGSYGLFLDNIWRSWFDFGRREEGILAIGAVHGPITYYIITGPGIADVVRRYTDLTGKAPLMPRWALGYQQSRWGYMSAQEISDIATRLRAERIPADVVWMDIDYQDRNRPFTINQQTFPDLPKLTRDMEQLGIKLVSIVDLHVAHANEADYTPFASGTAGNHFVHNPDGSVYVAPVWPGAAVFPDFTRADTRDWFGAQYRTIIESGIAGIWNDMNEPAVFKTPTKTAPLDVVHRIEGDGFVARNASHAEIHNIFGMENTRATYDGLRHLRPKERAFVMTRASFAGGQKYAATWTGDNSSTWDHLKLMVSQLLNLGLSGFSYSGADVGGFIGGATPELMTRWFQIASFTPVFRNHSAKDAPRAEPWVDGPEHLAIRRRFVEERYRLMPFLYTLAANNARTGAPIMRPVFYDYLAMLSTPCHDAMTFTLGGKLLVGGNPQPEARQPYRICLPAGGWYDYWTGAPVVANPVNSASYGQITVTPVLDTLPVFVRAGTILPRQPLVQSTAQQPNGPLELHVYPGPECNGEIYDDDGHSMDFERGGYLRQMVHCTRPADGSMRVSFEAREGTFKPWWTSITLIVHDGERRYKLRGSSLQAASHDATREAILSIPDQPKAATIVLDAIAR